MNTRNGSDWLDQYQVRRPIPISGLAESFERIIKTARREEEIQRFLTKNPFILSSQLPHCHFVIPKFQFGDRYVADFLLLETASSGWTWVIVELKPANVQLVTQSGHLAERVRVGVDQVKDCRRWLKNNRDHACRSRSSDGLGLEQIDGVWGWVVVGRRSQVSPRFNELRNENAKNSRVEILTYDRLLDWFKTREAHWIQWERSTAGLGLGLGSGSPGDN
jgi:hypothetical protein